MPYRSRDRTIGHGRALGHGIERSRLIFSDMLQHLPNPTTVLLSKWYIRVFRFCPFSYYYIALWAVKPRMCFLTVGYRNLLAFISRSSTAVSRSFKFLSIGNNSSSSSKNSQSLLPCGSLVPLDGPTLKTRRLAGRKTVLVWMIRYIDQVRIFAMVGS